MRAATSASGMRGIVLDLRGNPGGLLDQAVAVVRPVPRPRADRLDPWPPSRQPPVFRGHAGRCHRWPAGRRAGQRRLGLGVGDRRRRLAGQRARRRRRQQFLWQGHGADRAAPAQRWRADADLGPLPRAVGLHPPPYRRAALDLHQPGRGCPRRTRHGDRAQGGSRRRDPDPGAQCHQPDRHRGLEQASRHLPGAQGFTAFSPIWFLLYMPTAKYATACWKNSATISSNQACTG